jgi:hypothetical protein
MDFYGRYLEVSFRKEDHGNGEFIALKAPDGESNGKSPAIEGGTLPNVQPPVSALGSLSERGGTPLPCVALSSGPAEESVQAETLSVNSGERIAP